MVDLRHDDPLNRLVAELGRLPGIGPKTATRLAHHVLRRDRDDVARLASALIDVKDRLIHCSTCHAITAHDPCAICDDPRRDQRQICVVEEPFNIAPIERTGEYYGRYHVLLGALSPHRGIGPERLTIESLLTRCGESVEEVILATNPNVEGEATALYLARVLRPRGVAVTRLAFGMPVGGDIEFTDEVTLGRSLSGRRPL